MISLYLENSIIGSLFRFFSPYFSTAIQSTQFLLTWLVIAQLASQSFPSLRFSPEFLVPGDASLLEQLLPGASEWNGDESVSPPANGGIGVQIDFHSLTEWAGLPQCRWYDGTVIWNASPQELRSHISWQIQLKYFWALWSLRPKPQKIQRT